MEKNITNKKEYHVPEISHVILDNEISLQMTSNPPGFTNEAMILKPEFLKNDPFHSDIV